MKKKLTLTLALVTALALTLTGCASGKKDSGAANRLEAIRTRGYLEVATEPYFAPYEFIDSSKTGSDQYVGMDIEIARYIAEKLEVELRIVPLEFSAVQAGIAEKKYDMAISAMAYTPERAESMNMSKAYYIAEEGEGYGLLVRTEDADQYPDAASLEQAVVVMQSASLQELLVTSQIPETKEVKRVSATTDGFLMVSEGKADACACDIANGRLYAEANPGVTIANGFRFVQDESIEGTRVCIPKGEDALTEFVNQCIDELDAAGKTAEWYAEYAAYAKTLGID